MPGPKTAASRWLVAALLHVALCQVFESNKVSISGTQSEEKGREIVTRSKLHLFKLQVFLVPTWCSNCKGVLVSVQVGATRELYHEGAAQSNKLVALSPGVRGLWSQPAQFLKFCLVRLLAR